MRMDSAFYSKGQRNLREQAKKWVPLGAFAERVVCGPFGSMILDSNYVENGFPMLRPFNLRNMRSDANEIVYLPKSFVKQCNLKCFSRGDLAFARVGDVGCSVIVQDHVTISPNVIVAELNRDKINPYFVSFFFNTKYGRMQMEGAVKAVAQPTISTGLIRELRIPCLSQSFQDRIQSLFEKSETALLQANRALSTAESTLLTALGLEDWQPPDPLTYTRNSRDVFAAERLDAEHYNEKFFAARQALLDAGASKLIPLEFLLDSITNGHTPLHHDLTIGAVPFLCAEHIADFRVNYASEKRITMQQHRTELARTALTEGDLVLTIKGRVGNVAIVENPPSHANINQDVALLRITERLPKWYAVAFLNSYFGKLQIEQFSTGAINPFLGLSNVKKLLIPEFDQQIMNEIAEKTKKNVHEARDAQESAHAFLEKAKRAVEIAIEEGEERSLWFVNKRICD